MRTIGAIRAVLAILAMGIFCAVAIFSRSSIGSRLTWNSRRTSRSGCASLSATVNHLPQLSIPLRVLDLLLLPIFVTAPACIKHHTPCLSFCETNGFRVEQVKRAVYANGPFLSFHHDTARNEDGFIVDPDTRWHNDGIGNVNPADLMAQPYRRPEVRSC
ncbi:MAG: hypothetical protein SNJ62_07715, partial [Chloracidobacterium sp.]